MASASKEIVGAQAGPTNTQTAQTRPAEGAPMTYLDIFSLEGKVALVPGGGGAIGSAIA